MLENTCPAPKRQRRDKSLTDTPTVTLTAKHILETSKTERELDTNVNEEAEKQRPFLRIINSYKWVNEDSRRNKRY